jgi:hypothetical protein
MRYKVFFTDGSTDLIEAESAADARDTARADFGGRVRRVEVVEDGQEDEDLPDDEDVEDDDDEAAEEDDADSDEDDEDEAGDTGGEG